MTIDEFRELLANESLHIDDPQFREPFNILNGYGRDFGAGAISVDNICQINASVMGGIPAPYGPAHPFGEVRKVGVGVGRYKCPPAQDCTYLLERLCEWLNDDAAKHDFNRFHPLAFPIIQALTAHLYIAWIHPFIDGNGRTARFLEYITLVRGGIPDEMAYLTAPYFLETRNTVGGYYDKLDMSSRIPEGHVNFLTYALRGFGHRLEVLNQPGAGRVFELGDKVDV